MAVTRKDVAFKLILVIFPAPPMLRLMKMCSSWEKISFMTQSDWRVLDSLFPWNWAGALYLHCLWSPEQWMGPVMRHRCLSEAPSCGGIPGGDPLTPMNGRMAHCSGRRGYQNCPRWIKTHLKRNVPRNTYIFMFKLWIFINIKHTER